MNPDKLFDYLDGKLSPSDRDELEAKLAVDSQLQRQLAVAREIHRGMSGSQRAREVFPSPDDVAVAERGGKLGRRIATACVALMLLNVLVGLGVIAFKNKKPVSNEREAKMRQQLATSLGAAAQNALPVPSFAAAEIQLAARRTEWDTIARRITGAAESVGGSAARGLPADDALTVVVDIPSSKEPEFRQLLSPAGASGAHPPAIAEAAAATDRTIVQVRIADGGR
ncbi:MAG: hypothetical protein H0X73_15225 [Chthoniobacterales bacterium]|nr:hypothetical protein [Chthoniobacterales bacterium]